MSLDIDMVETFFTDGEDVWSVIGVIKADDGYYVGTEGISDFVGPMSFDDMCEEVRSIAKMYHDVDRTDLDEYLGSLE